MYGPRPIRFSAHCCADYSKYQGGGGTDITGKQVNAIAQSMKSIQIEQKSTIIDNHKNECDRFLTIFDICRLINIDFIDYYRFLWSIEIIDL